MHQDVTFISCETRIFQRFGKLKQLKKQSFNKGRKLSAKLVVYKVPYKSLKKVLSSRLGKGVSLAGKEAVKAHLLDGQGFTHVICQLNHYL